MRNWLQALPRGVKDRVTRGGFLFGYASEKVARVYRDLSERQHSCTRLVRPIERNDGAQIEFDLAVPARPEVRNRVLLVPGAHPVGA
jgi:hypothetical protein